MRRGISKHRLDFFVGRDFAASRSGEDLVNLAQLFARRAISTGVDLTLDLISRLGQIPLRPFRPAGGAFKHVLQGLACN